MIDSNDLVADPTPHFDPVKTIIFTSTKKSACNSTHDVLSSAAWTTKNTET